MNIIHMYAQRGVRPKQGLCPYLNRLGGEGCSAQGPIRAKPQESCKRATQKNMLQSLWGTKTKRAANQLRICNRNKFKNVSSYWKNILSNIPKEVLQSKLDFQVPKTLPIWRGNGGKVEEGARRGNFMG
jgi:hypothetical protein